jgi:phosphoglycerol transferase MdoB-like AlkP superfamily enzyme
MLVVYGDYHQHLFEVFLVLLAILVAAVCWSLWLTPNRILIMPFYLTALYCLITPIFADYHLLVFIAPILLVLLNFQKWAGNYHLISAIVLGSILMLSPKNYYFVSGTSIQLLLNPLILFILTLYLVKESVCGSKSKLLEGAAGVHAPAIRGMNWKFGHASK